LFANVRIVLTGRRVRHAGNGRPKASLMKDPFGNRMKRIFFFSEFSWQNYFEWSAFQNKTASPDSRLF
jgi:hypothetical protein